MRPYLLLLLLVSLTVQAAWLRRIIWNNDSNTSPSRLSADKTSAGSFEPITISSPQSPVDTNSNGSSSPMMPFPMSPSSGQDSRSSSPGSNSSNSVPPFSFTVPKYERWSDFLDDWSRVKRIMEVDLMGILPTLSYEQVRSIPGRAKLLWLYRLGCFMEALGGTKFKRLFKQTKPMEAARMLQPFWDGHLWTLAMQRGINEDEIEQALFKIRLFAPQVYE